MKNIIITAIAILAIITPYAGARGQEAKKPLQVVASLFPLYDIAKSVGGDKVSVSLLLAPGVEAHHFDPTPANIAAINRANVFVYSSDLMEPWAKKILASLNNKNLTIVNSGATINFVNNDPHVWLDFTRATQMVTAVAAGLAAADPANKSFYTARGQDYNRQLMTLDADYKKTIGTCRTRTIVYAGHNTFDYLARRYNLGTRAASGASDMDEPTAADIKSIIDDVKKNNINYIFYEELSEKKLAASLARETKTRLLLLHGAHEVSKDDIANGTSFIAIMRQNLKNLSLGLSCQPA